MSHAAGRMAGQAVENIRTVLSLGRARVSLEQYCAAVGTLAHDAWKQAQVCSDRVYWLAVCGHSPC